MDFSNFDLRDEPIDLDKRFTKNSIHEFVGFMNSINDDIGFKVSSRGWGYILEQKGFITKDQFDKVESLINRCRKEGLLPVDFVAEESSRSFHEIHTPETRNYREFLADWIQYPLSCVDWYEPNWWEGEEYYIQMIVEKIDLVTLFQPLCKKYHIPIANAKGWSSISQRAEYARRFKEAEGEGMKCVLLYCGDHDPDGLRISDTLRKNLRDIRYIEWSDGTTGYNPKNLIIERFGLNYDFIIRNNLTWIDNLITGSGRNLADRRHKNHHMTYVQQYLREVGERKCEANSVVVIPQMGRQMCERAIQSFLGTDALDRFKNKKKETIFELKELISEFEIEENINNIINKLNR